jgi:hypothetical protein
VREVPYDKRSKETIMAYVGSLVGATSKVVYHLYMELLM